MDRTWHLLGKAVWLVFLILFATGVYVNWNLPHGPMYSTGDIVCENDGRWPCHEQYVEDTHALNIPTWTKFFRTSQAELIIFGLALAGVIISSRPKGGYRKTDTQEA